MNDHYQSVGQVALPIVRCGAESQPAIVLCCDKILKHTTARNAAMFQVAVA